MIKKENLAEATQAQAVAKALKEERLARKAENEKRAEVVQKISSGKLKRMKKKQLRCIKNV
jgi:rRNA-processing protein CGR1